MPVVGLVHKFEVTSVQAAQDIRRQRTQPSTLGLQRVTRQLEDIQTKLDLLDRAYPAAQAELLSDWPSALHSPNLENEIPRLHGMHQKRKARSRHFDLMKQLL